MYLLKKLQKLPSTFHFVGIQCVKLFKPEYGYISYVSSKSMYGGTTVLFSCINGYQLIGSSSRNCTNVNEEAKWTGKQPYCIRKLEQLDCLYVLPI